MYFAARVRNGGDATHPADSTAAVVFSVNGSALSATEPIPMLAPGQSLTVRAPADSAAWLARVGVHKITATLALRGAVGATTLDSTLDVAGTSPYRRTARPPIDLQQQLALEFGDRSFWLQPWRAYLDTFAASRMTQAVGINFNVTADQADATARLLSSIGFRRARVELPWCEVAFDGPVAWRDPAALIERLRALRNHGLRPLILLNGHDGCPGPMRTFDITLTRAAPAGATTVQLDARSAALAVAHRTGLTTFGKAADPFFTSVSAGVAQLSRPLPAALPAGAHPAATLKFRPFFNPRNRDGSPQGIYEETLAGWLDYVDLAVATARSVLGADHFDIELWNELTFGSSFLSVNDYYEPNLDAGIGSVVDDIPARTVRHLTAQGPSAYGMANGFASQVPWPAGSTAPVGLTALSKHPYAGLARYPETRRAGRPLDWNGSPAGREQNGLWIDDFVPTYVSFYPEYALNAEQTEHLIRDLSPYLTRIYEVEHGRTARPSGGRPVGLMVTEIALDSSGADPSSPGDRAHIATLTAADVWRMRAKATLRYLSSYVGKGADAVYFYAVRGGPNLEMIAPEFFDALAATGLYPGAGDAGLVAEVLPRFLERFSADSAPAAPRSLTLIEIADTHDRRQFDGDGTAAHPPLFDRDVVAFFPFQRSARRFVIPVYVMTRNLAALYRPEASADDATRYDLPPERFRLTIGGVDGERVSARLYDPLSREVSAPIVVTRARDRIVLEVELTDSVRLLELDDA